MGYQIPANSPQITIGTRTVAVAAWQFSSVVIPNPYNKVAIYDLQNSAWIEVVRVGEYENPGDMLADVVAKGGIVKYLAWIVAQINVGLSTLFSAGPAPTPTPAPVEPTTDAQALADVNALFASMKLTNVNGVPVLS